MSSCNIQNGITITFSSSGNPFRDKTVDYRNRLLIDYLLQHYGVSPDDCVVWSYNEQPLPRRLVWV